MTARLHTLVAILVCVAVPLISWAYNAGAIAWTMFSSSEHYRLELRAYEAAGRERVIDPNALVAYAPRDLAVFLVDAGAWRHDTIAPIFRDRLASIGALACPFGDGAREVRVTLYERRHLDAPVRTSTARVACAP